MAVFESLDEVIDRKGVAKARHGGIEPRRLFQATAAGHALGCGLGTHRAGGQGQRGQVVVALRAEQRHPRRSCAKIAVLRQQCRRQMLAEA